MYGTLIAAIIHLVLYLITLAPMTCAMSDLRGLPYAEAEECLWDNSFRSRRRKTVPGSAVGFTLTTFTNVHLLMLFSQYKCRSYGSCGLRRPRRPPVYTINHCPAVLPWVSLPRFRLLLGSLPTCRAVSLVWGESFARYSIHALVAVTR